MLHKKRKPSTFTSSSGFADCKRNAASNNNMLHSKSTYFYRWVSNLGVARRSYNSANGKTSSKVGHDFANEFRESSHHCEKSNTTSGTAHAILTRSRRQTNSYSKITDRPGYIVPVGCSLALLLGVGFIVNPTAGKIETVHAAESSSDKCMNGEASSTGQCPMELSLTMSGTNGTGAYEEAGATQLEVGKTAYRSYDFKVSATDIDKDGYKLYATAVETKLGEADLTNQLVNADYPDKETFIPISATEGVVGDSMTAGEWGYTIAGGNTGNTIDTANTNPGSLTYKAVPTAQTAPIATGTETTTTDSGIPDNPATVPDEYKLIFGAKAAEDMPSGHYRAQVMLSLVASAKQVVIGLGGITKMSEMTSAHCASLKTPAANAEIKEVPTGQLIDDREGENGTKYWVSKLADGNCWMTQNMMYSSGISGGNFNTSKSDIVVDGTTEIDIANKVLSNDPTMSAAINGNVYNGHFRIGNYYTFDQASKVCDFSSKQNSNWGLPSSAFSSSGAHLSTENGSFGNLVATYNIQYSGRNNAPYYFIPSGGIAYTSGKIEFIGNEGRWWSSSVYGGKYHALYIGAGLINAHYDLSLGKAAGISVRCLVLGK